jgi:hypothetical protein
MITPVPTFARSLDEPGAGILQAGISQGPSVNGRSDLNGKIETGYALDTGTLAGVIQS